MKPVDPKNWEVPEGWKNLKDSECRSVVFTGDWQLYKEQIDDEQHLFAVYPANTADTANDIKYQYQAIVRSDGSCNKFGYSDLPHDVQTAFTKLVWAAQEPAERRKKEKEIKEREEKLERERKEKEEEEEKALKDYTPDEIKLWDKVYVKVLGRMGQPHYSGNAPEEEADTAIEERRARFGKV